jgi:signal transduction histidine kinase
MDEVDKISHYENWTAIIEQIGLHTSGKINADELRRFILKEYKDKISKYFGSKINYNKIIIENNNLDCLIELKDSLRQNDIVLLEKNSSEFSNEISKIANGKNVSIAEDVTNKKIYLGTTIRNNNSDAKEGVLLFQIDMTLINSIMFTTNVLNGLGMTGEAYVVGSDKIIRTSSRFKSNSINKLEVNTIAVEEAFRNITGTGEYKDYRKIPVLGSYGKIDISGLNWAILVEIDLEEAMIPIYSLRNNIIIIGLLIALIIFGIVYLISLSITTPIIKLKQAVDSIAQGKYDISLENNTTDEISDLMRAFNKMASKIKMQTEEIQMERSKRITSVIDGQEQERQRLSRELHDGLGQHILAIKMKLERAEKANPDLKQQIIDEAKNLLTAASREVVSMSENLMPPVLTQFGLISAIENLCEDIRINKDVVITFNFNEIPENFDSNIKIYLYRIIQEALNNIVKHAEATIVDVSFLFENKTINLAISDNGKGFDITQKRKAGNGIYNMNDRAEILGGTFNIISAPGQGTTILVKLKISSG